MGRAQALELLKGADELYAAKGKKVVHVNLRESKPESAIDLMLGPTGNLRAPTVRRGRTLIVGYEEGMYRDLLK
jgi:hypothetical protein